jgi:hypothetical protein
MKTNVKAMKSRKSRSNDRKIEFSGGTVYADFGFQDAEERLLKAKLAREIARLIEKERLDSNSNCRADGFGPGETIAPFVAASFPDFQRIVCSSF